MLELGRMQSFALLNGVWRLEAEGKSVDQLHGSRLRRQRSWLRVLGKSM